MNRQQRFFTAINAASDIEVVMHRVATQLAAATVTARADAERRSYFIDSDDVATTDRPLADAADILIKLRPDMIYSRAKNVCPGILNIWINGLLAYRHIKQPIVVGAPGGKRAAGVEMYPVSETARQRVSVAGSPASAIGGGRLTVLERIRPEHVEQISYKDCFDTSMKGNFGQNALFIVLKVGIRYEPGVGTYAIDGSRPPR